MRAMTPRILPLLFVCAVPTSVQTIAFHAEEGLRVTRTLECSSTMALEEQTLLVDGQDHQAAAPEFSVERTRSAIVEDVYGPLGSGRPLTLRRTFAELDEAKTMEVEGPDGPQPMDQEYASDLEGRTVLFELDEDDGMVARFDDEGEGDDELLRALVEDMDLRAFLPEDPEAELEPGDSWEVDPEAIWLARLPGGIDLQRDQERDAGSAEVDRQLREETRGELVATYAGLRTVDGIEQAVIEIEADLGSAAEAVVDREGGEVEMQLSEEYELEGELLWNLEAGVLGSLELSGEVTFHSTELSEVEMGDRSFELERRSTLTGELSIRLTVELE